jgi:hypothetical protein
VAGKRGNLLAIRAVMSPPWRDISGNIKRGGASHNWDSDPEIQCQVWARDCRASLAMTNQRFFELFTNASNLVRFSHNWKDDPVNLVDPVQYDRKVTKGEWHVIKKIGF